MDGIGPTFDPNSGKETKHPKTFHYYGNNAFIVSPNFILTIARSDDFFFILFLSSHFLERINFKSDFGNVSQIYDSQFKLL